MEMFVSHRKNFAYLLFLIVATLASSPTVFAQGTLPTGSFVVMPARQEVTLDPGGAKTLNFTLTNGTPVPLHVTTSLEDIAPNVQATAVDDPITLLGSKSGQHSLKELLSISGETQDIGPGTQRVVSVTLKVPKDIVPGGRYGSVVFTFAPSGSDAGGPANVAIESRIASTIYLRINGTTHEEGSLVAFGLFNDARTVGSPSQDVPLRLQVAYENTGDVYLNPYGRITVSGLWGTPHLIAVDPWAVLPQATRMREFDLAEPLVPGVYTAHLDLNRGYGDVIDTKEVRFYVLPTPLTSMLIIVGSILFIFLLRRSLQLSRHSIS